MHGSPRTPNFDFLWRWGGVTLVGAVALSTADALLLQRSRSFFTGGFLSVDHLTGPADIAAFLVVSLVTDGALVGVLAGLVMWMLCRQRVRTSACVVAGLLAGVGPPMVANFISYELGRYMGDAADLALMFELTGGSLPELFAVASSYLVTPGLMVAGAVGGAGGLVWAIHRWSPQARAMRASAKVLWVPGLCALAALVIAVGASASSDAMENGLLRKPSGKVLAFVADGVSDIDRDGFGIAGRLSDPDAFNPSIFPYGLDFPGNGIDEDGVGGDFPSGEPAYIEPPGPSTPWVRRPDVVLIVLESFRADLVGARHEGRPVTPVLDTLAARGVSSRRAYSHNGYTSQSRFHLFSGSLAGVRDGRTLIDDFNANGYLTAVLLRSGRVVRRS